MLKPLLDRVVIKIKENNDRSKSGIILKESDKEKTQIAEVLEIGQGTKEVKMEVKKGDKVVVNKYAGTEIKYEGEDFIIISQNDILAIVD